MCIHHKTDARDSGGQYNSSLHCPFTAEDCKHVWRRTQEHFHKVPHAKEKTIVMLFRDAWPFLHAQVRMRLSIYTNFSCRRRLLPLMPNKTGSTLPGSSEIASCTNIHLN